MLKPPLICSFIIIVIITVRVRQSAENVTWETRRIVKNK